MALALYRKYRSQDFSELVGQDHVSKTLANALEAGRITHAYLFTGPRGVGKTSTARIFARQVNGLSEEESRDHLDIIEIDAASNRRIDEIRDLREKVHVAPTSADYKVYIIDEVHMLTTEAFNALLKTLEEPPSHAIFILATTEPHKLPETIISRTQRFSFRPVEMGKVVGHLRTIADAERIKISDEALQLVAEAGGGSFRDSISVLDQLSNITDGEIDAETVQNALGMAQLTILENITQAVAAKEPARVLDALESCRMAGISPTQVHSQLIDIWQRYLRISIGVAEPRSEAEKSLMEKLSSKMLTGMVQRLSELVTNSTHLDVALEVNLIDLALAPTTTPAHKVLTTAMPAATAKKANDDQPLEPKKPRRTETPTPERTQPRGEFSEDAWLRALTLVKKTNNSLYALLRSSTPEFNDEKLHLKFRFQFHRRRLEEHKNRDVLERALEKTLGYKLPVVALLDDGKTKKKPQTKQEEVKEDSAAVKNVLEILGGEVV